jgi:glycosyltransferase involved in cell wall biosynthesis
MRVAIIADWLVAYAGGERVIEQMLKVYPDADLFTTVDFFPEEHRPALANKKAKTSFIQKLPFAKTQYRNYLPLMPFAVEQFDLSSYDLIISNSSSVAKGVITGPEQLHICYCLSPMRYAWDLQHQYLSESGLTKGFKSFLARYILYRMRQWDARTASNVDAFVGISHFIKRRIDKVYRRDADVIYPPVDTDSFLLETEKDDFYLTASRMVPYKKMALIVEAFTKMPDKKLIVIGDGPDFKRIEKMAGKNVTLLGYQSFEVLRNHLQKARAFLFASLEDFGIAPIEAQACGTPVIAYGKGGASETILGQKSGCPTGVLFYEQSTESIINAVADFEEKEGSFSPEACRQNALRFSNDNFIRNFTNFVEEQMEIHKSKEFQNIEKKEPALQTIS